jgi:transposase InsO family protein
MDVGELARAEHLSPVHNVTYIPLESGFAYLAAIMDWHSRRVLAWRLSNTMETDFCLVALEETGGGRPVMTPVFSFSGATQVSRRIRPEPT